MMAVNEKFNTNIFQSWQNIHTIDVTIQSVGTPLPLCAVREGFMGIAEAVLLPLAHLAELHCLLLFCSCTPAPAVTVQVIPESTARAQ